MSSRAEDAPPVVVVTAIIVNDPEAVALTAAAVRRQVYESARVVLVGDSTDVRQQADGEGLAWAPTLSALLDAPSSGATHLWVLRAGAVPRPDALGALVMEAERNGAAIAGSKLLQADSPEQLVSVGLATDVFDVPYVGLDADEIDAGQYDVVRDVAAVSGASILMRRDLARGVDGPDPRLAPLPAAVDLCQRARLRGARVIVVPSSEVMVQPDTTAAKAWREEAGRIRAMLKVYSVLTLLWTIPLTFLIGLLEAIVAPFVGRWTLFAWARAWLWNVFALPWTVLARRQARKGRVVDDAELFRYQLRGSARLRGLGGEIGSKLRARLGLEEGFDLAGLGRDLRQPAFVVGVMAAVFALFATRRLWGGRLPAVGYSLPLPSSGPDAVAAYAGGWNPAGMGSIEPLRPFVGLAGAVQTVLFDNPDLTLGVLVIAAALSALWGTTRMLRAFGIETVAALLGAGVLLAGPAARAMMDDTGLTSWLALGVLPWAVRVSVARFPTHWLGRVGRVAAVGWVTGLLAVISPLLALAPLTVLIVWALMNPLTASSWRSVAVAALGAGLAVPALLPWLADADLERFVEAGSAYWEPGWFLVAGLGVALVGTVLAAPERLGLATIWGGVLVALGALVARADDFGAGREVEQAGLAVASLGSAVVVAGALDLLRRVEIVVGWRRIVGGVALLAALVVTGSTFLVLIPGRAGLPADTLRDRIAFTAAAEGDPTSSRILLVGPPDSLPGDSRVVQGAGYRVVSAPVPSIVEAWLPDPTGADEALERALEGIIEGDTFRAGEVLGSFGIRWVISTGETPLEGVFAGQLDLVPLGVGEGVALTFDGQAPTNAVTDSGTSWERTGTGYRGDPEAGTVRIAESANGRWAPEWTQTDWANQLSAAEGEVRFRHLDYRRTQALTAAISLVFLMAVSWLGRRRA